jgi:phosphate transport system ATP-binding protein
MFKIKNLSLSFKEKNIFKNINMDIQSNEISAIVGPSGTGKTSFLLCLNQMIRHEENYNISGEVLYKDDNKYINLLTLNEDNLSFYRKQIVYVSQHPDILPMSIYENLAFIAKIHKIKNYEQKIVQVLKQVYLYEEIKDRLNINANSLSGGQQQRLILSRALLLEPKVLLLDEPTASLNEELASKIDTMLKNENKTIVIISHFKNQIKNLTSNTYSLSY